MNPGDWYKLKERVYYWDDFEQWRDMYILHTTKEDWSNWIDLVNQLYPVEFYNGQTMQTTFSIDKQIVFDYLEGKTNLLNGAVIKVGRIHVKCHFFSLSEIENDIDPREVENEEDHESLMEYLKEISRRLSKPVLLTEENIPEDVLIKVENDEVTVCFQ